MDIMLPFSGQSITVNEMTGYEEDMLADEKKMRDGRALNHLMANCSKLPYNDVVALTMPDRLALLLAIRRETFGDVVTGTLRCPNRTCKKQMPISGLTLAELASYPAERSQFGPTGQYTVTLSNGYICNLRLLSGKDEQVLSSVGDDERMTFMLLVPLSLVVKPDGTKVEDNDKKKWLKGLSSKYRNELRGAIEDNQFGYDTRFKSECPACGTEVEGTLEGLNGFFTLSSPQRKRENSSQ